MDRLGDRFDIMNSSMSGEETEPTFNLRLIEAVKQSTCLYDQNDRQYRCADIKMKVWTRLANVLQYEGDKNMLANRWKQLRDKYGKEKKKLKETGEGPSWQYYKHLAFLDPHMIDRNKDGKKFPDKQLPPISDTQFAQNLINEVQRQPCLYDRLVSFSLFLNYSLLYQFNVHSQIISRDPKYRHSECRTMAWNQVVSSLKYPGDLNSVAKQWKTLRDHYVRERRFISEGLREDSSWELYPSMQWMGPYVADREKNRDSQRPKRIRRESVENLSDDPFDETIGGFMTPRPKQSRAPDVLLDGDSAFAASAVSDLRSLTEHARSMARMQIEHLLLNSGSRMGSVSHQIVYDAK
ncbi:madf-3 [Pristionchus pacificus]|uniref:Madf-3 n=1 Tax=Pristionchus pacificus TaxID=54126 RepID=A0A2A6D3D5_PRIPA|nr:madf-3 [Pristionchus pacificus]|eukprot:PDM84909.1 madf-3 [Pristionchus pacificus]